VQYCRGLPLDDLSDLSVEAIKDRASRLESFWGDLHTQQEIDHSIFNLEWAISVPDGYNVVRPGTGNVVIESMADHVGGDGPVVKVPVPNASKKAEDLSEDLEKWLQAALYRFQHRETTPQLRSLIVDMGWGGMAVSFGPVFDSEVWGPDPKVNSTTMTATTRNEAEQAYDEQKKMRWPFIWRTLDPRYVFPDPGTHGRRYVIVKYRRNAGEIAEAWPEWSGRVSDSPQTYRDTDEVDFLELWTPDHKAYIAGSELLQATPHRYGKPPFQIRSAGFGTASGKPHERYRSLIWAARSAIVQESKAATQFDAVMRNAAWTHMLTPIGSAFKQLTPGKTTPMNIADIEHTRAVTEIKPEVVTALMQELGIIDKWVQAATYPSVVRGEKVSDVGYTTNSLAALARIRFTSIANQIGWLLEDFCADLLNCVEHVVEEPVPIFGPTKRGYIDMVLDPEKINGTRYVTVKLNPKLPIDRANEIQTGAMLRQMGAIDKNTMIEDFAGYEQPEEMRIKIMRDEILERPFIKNILEMAAADQIGLLDWLMQKAQQLGIPSDQILAAMRGGGIGAPPGPGGPPQAPLGGPSPLNPNPTSQTEPVPGELPPQNGSGNLPSQIRSAPEAHGFARTIRSQL